jgi:hypothetical protein
LADNLAPIEGAEHHAVGGLEVDVARVGAGRMKRLVYPPGYRWTTHMKSIVKTDYCMHTHVGYLVQGHLKGVYADGCEYEIKAPAFAAIQAEHDAWVVGDEPAVFVQFDFEEGTARRFGLPERHEH